MKPIKKAYRVTSDDDCLIYGDSWKRVVNDYCSSMDCVDYWEAKQMTTASRFRDGDLFKVKIHESLNGLCDECISKLLHCLGLKHNYERDLPFMGRFGRNNYLSGDSEDPHLEKMVELGLMKSRNTTIGIYYHTTDLGKRAASSLLLHPRSVYETIVSGKKVEFAEDFSF